MADRGAKYADKKLSEIDRELRKVYRQAQKELTAKLSDFNNRHRQKDREKRQQMDKGEISKQQYKDWLAGQVFMRGQWERKLDQVNQVMLHHNEQAMRIINDSRLDVFAENYYSEGFKAKWIIQDVGFNVYSTHAIARLLEKQPQILPKWKVDEEKDYKWNEKKVNNIIQQGIIQGESVDQIGKRLCEGLSSQNESKMTMFARTAITEAQNAGRQVQMEQSAAAGIKVNKRWIATLDNRTRDIHRARDGEEVPYNEEFSGGIEYPGDPTAPPEEVYNCRCTMETVYPEYADRSKEWREDETIDGVPYEEWKEAAQQRLDEKAEREKERNKANETVESLRDIAERSKDKYEFWLSLDEKQQKMVMESGVNFDDLYNSLGGGSRAGEAGEWKAANPGGASSFGIAHDFSGNGLQFQEVAPRSDGWMADAAIPGLIRVRNGGLGDEWDWIIAHEAGHQLSNACAELQSMILMNPGNILGRYNTRVGAFEGIYGEYNPEEAFATGVSVFVRHPEDMMEKYPDAYKAFEAFFDASPSARGYVESALEEYRRRFNP